MAYRGPDKNKQDIIKIYSFSSNETYEFPLFLTEFNDQRTANWTSQEIYGKMDPIYTYKNTVRKISIGLDVPSFTSEEALENRNTIIMLQDCLYPVYSERKGELGAANLSSPPLFRVYIPGLLYKQEIINRSEFFDIGLLGWIDNFNYKPELESGFFYDKKLSYQPGIYAKLFKISFNLNVIHEVPLGFSTNHRNRVIEAADTSSVTNNTPANLTAEARSQTSVPGRR